MALLKHLFDAADWRASNAWYRLLSTRPLDLIRSLRFLYRAETTNLATLGRASIPARIEGFHDLAYLFACHPANRGLIAQDFDEAAYLWKVIVAHQPRHILEIGRWLGGSTILMCAAAAQYGGRLISVDAKIQAPEYASDVLLQQHLQQLGLDNYDLRVASSQDFNPGRQIQLAFIDGDHAYEAVKKDFENVKTFLSPGGDLLFHDSCAARQFASRHEPVARLVREVKASPDFHLVREVGSITHFKEHE